MADLMDKPELIRNVCIAGHLHSGKVIVFIFTVYLYPFESVCLRVFQFLVSRAV